MRLNELLEIIDGYVVGGAVRDLYMGRKPHDYEEIMCRATTDNWS